jgi:hypothetical protein
LAHVKRHAELRAFEGLGGGQVAKQIKRARIADLGREKA